MAPGCSLQRGEGVSAIKTNDRNDYSPPSAPMGCRSIFIPEQELPKRHFICQPFHGVCFPTVKPLDFLRAESCSLLDSTSYNEFRLDGDDLV
eukprot:6436507-Amphidinium_carterae.1